MLKWSFLFLAIALPLSYANVYYEHHEQPPYTPDELKLREAAMDVENPRANELEVIKKLLFDPDEDGVLETLEKYNFYSKFDQINTAPKLLHHKIKKIFKNDVVAVDDLDSDDLRYKVHELVAEIKRKHRRVLRKFHALVSSYYLDATPDALRSFVEGMLKVDDSTLNLPENYDNYWKYKAKDLLRLFEQHGYNLYRLLAASM